MSKPAENVMVDYLGLVRALAWKIHQKVPRHIELDDLFGYGCVGLAEAAKNFDPSRGLKFTTFAYYRIRGAILDGLSKMSWFDPADFHSGAYEHSSAGDDADADSAADSHRPGVNMDEELAWFQSAAQRLHVTSLTDSAGVMRDVSDKNGAPEKELMRREATGRVRELMDELPGVAGDLMRAAYFEGLTLKEAGHRLGHDKSWASRLHAKTLQRFAVTLKSEGLG